MTTSDEVTADTERECSCHTMSVFTHQGISTVQYLGSDYWWWGNIHVADKQTGDTLLPLNACLHASRHMVFPEIFNISIPVHLRDHEVTNKQWINAGPTSMTLGQYWSTAGLAIYLSASLDVSPVPLYQHSTRASRTHWYVCSLSFYRAFDPTIWDDVQFNCQIKALKLYIIVQNTHHLMTFFFISLQRLISR